MENSIWILGEIATILSDKVPEASDMFVDIQREWRRHGRQLVITGSHSRGLESSFAKLVASPDPIHPGHTEDVAERSVSFLSAYLEILKIVVELYSR